MGVSSLLPRTPEGFTSHMTHLGAPNGFRSSLFEPPPTSQGAQKTPGALQLTHHLSHVHVLAEDATNVRRQRHNCKTMPSNQRHEF